MAWQVYCACWFLGFNFTPEYSHGQYTGQLDGALVYNFIFLFWNVGLSAPMLSTETPCFYGKLSVFFFNWPSG